MRKKLYLFMCFSFVAIQSQAMNGGDDPLRKSKERIVGLQQKLIRVEAMQKTAVQAREEAASTSSSPDLSPREWEEQETKFIRSDRQLRGCLSARAILNAQLRKERDRLKLLRGIREGEATYDAFDEDYDSCEDSCDENDIK